MSDINLLPIDEREKELQEFRKKIAEKSQVKIELSNPGQAPLIKEKGHNFFIILKDYFKKITSWVAKKQNKIHRQSPARPPKEPLRPQIPEHQINQKEINAKKIFYQTPRKPFFNEPAAPNKIPLPVKTALTQTPLAKVINLKSDLNKLNAVKIQPEIIKEKTVINLIPATIRKLAGEQLKLKILVIALIICLITILAVYFILNQIANQRESLAKELDSEIMAIETDLQRLKTNTQEIRDFSNLLQTIKKLLEQHVISTRIFNLLETNTLPDVSYNALSLNPVLSTVNLKASARNYQDLAEQILIFQSLPDIESVVIDGITLKKPGEENNEKSKKIELVTFNISLKLNSNFFLTPTIYDNGE